MENKDTEDCYFFLNGYCSKGNGCEFRHLEGVKDRPLCVNWLLEKCNDPNCPNRHPTLPRQKDGSRTVCFYNQACTRPDCPFFHAGTVASPATPRPDKESELTSGLTPRGDASKTTTVTTSPTTTVSPVMKTAIATRLASGPVRPQRKKGMALPELPPRDRAASNGEAEKGAKEKGAAKQSFVKSFEEILKEKEGQIKGVKPEPKKTKSEAISNTGNRAPLQQSEKTKPTKSARPQLPQMTSQRTSTNDQAKKAGDASNGKQRGALRQNNSGPSAQAPAARPSFGVKSLDELMKEGAIKQATASAAGAKETGVKRPREESAATTKALPQPQQKQQRAEPVVQQAATEDDDFERELEEIGIDDVNGTAEPFDDDELNELLAE